MALFTYPFCYVPRPEVRDAARALIGRIDADPSLRGLFSEGKMMGTLVCEEGTLYAFSGLAGGCSRLEGFVGPIFDYTDPDGYFRKREAEISAMPAGVAKSEASARLQDWLFSQYEVGNFKGERATIKEVFAVRGIVPPGGTGECAAPKLLQEALRRGWTPLSMGEFWYGDSPSSEVREQGRFYPSCMGKCGPLLSFMMQGLSVEPSPLDFQVPSEPEVRFVDSSIVVAVKPSGMLSVPGKTPVRSLLEILRDTYGPGLESCHRLDMDTSGLMVFARSAEAKVELERQFAEREVVKKYRARLEAGTKRLTEGHCGTISLPLAPDYYDRPRQIVSPEGKQAITKYQVLRVLPSGEVDVLFEPLTGRTHQLRVHSASSLGLGRPIVGDRLYGSFSDSPLCLSAVYLEFTHPLSGARLRFESE